MHDDVWTIGDGPDVMAHLLESIEMGDFEMKQQTLIGVNGKQQTEQTIIRGMQQYCRFVQCNCPIYAYLGEETVARTVTQARFSQGAFQVKIKGSTTWLTPSLMWAEEEK